MDGIFKGDKYYLTQQFDFGKTQCSDFGKVGG